MTTPYEISYDPADGDFRVDFATGLPSLWRRSYQEAEVAALAALEHRRKTQDNLAARVEARRLLEAAAERELVEDALAELIERTRGTRAEGKYRRAMDALQVGATWTALADGGWFVTRGNGDHWIDPAEGCDCPGAGASGWRCWGGALVEALETARARAEGDRVAWGKAA